MPYRNLSSVLLPHPSNNIGDGPEGPEVRTVADKLRSIILNKTLLSVNYDSKGKVENPEYWNGPSTVDSVSTHGKKLFITLNNGLVLMFSLGMTGRLQYSPGNHSNIRLDFGTCSYSGILRIITESFSVYFDDSRQIGHSGLILLHDKKEKTSDLGPDILDASLTKEIPTSDWLTLFRQKKIEKWSICKALMDQKLVAGIGNYLKSEILYYSEVSPFRIVSSLSDSEIEKIRIAAHAVIKCSYQHGGFTLESFISPDGSLGVYPAAVYGRSSDPVGREIVKIVHNPKDGIKTPDARTLYWVPSVQV